MLEVDKKEADILQKAIAQWQASQLINEQQAGELRQSYRIRETDWQLITLYIFIAAISCGLMAFGALVLDEKWIEIIRKKLSLTDGIIAVVFTALSAFLCYRGYLRNQRQLSFSLNRELFWLLPALSIGVSVVYLGKSLQYLGGNYGLFWLLATIIYGITGLALYSRLLWVTTLLCLIPAYVKTTYYFTNDAPYFMGMNLPCRMILLGVVMLLTGWLARRTTIYKPVKEITWTGGWLLLLLSGWLISIFGNTGSWQEWQEIRQFHLLWWVIFFTLLCITTLLFGIKTKDNMVRDMGVIFLLLDLYTRYFEYLWDHTNKGLFFGILALSFWWLGKWLEKIKGSNRKTKA